MTSLATEPRVRCARCRRPTIVCYCAALPRLDTTTRIVILQHPRERDMPIGTARMASLCLPQATLHVGVRWGEHAPLADALADPARPPILLYPGPGARDILREPPAGPVTLVVVDGTWSQAKTVVRDNPVLQGLPRYAFDTPEPSQYRIRREPRAEYVSTIEALMHVLGVLEGDPARFRALLDPLNAMVDAQLACQERAPRRTSYRVPVVPRAPSTRLPPALLRRFEDLVLVVGEANAWPYDAARDPERGLDSRSEEMGGGGHAGFAGGAGGDAPRGIDSLVHWVAHRLATGETFSAVAAPIGPLAPSTVFHVGLTEAELLAGASQAEVLARFAAFTRARDVVCAWGHHGTNLWHASGGELPAERIDLRAAAQRLLHRKVGSLETYAASLGPPPAPLAPGRAGRRLAMLAHVLAAWRALP